MATFSKVSFRFRIALVHIIFSKRHSLVYWRFDKSPGAKRHTTTDLLGHRSILRYSLYELYKSYEILQTCVCRRRFDEVKAKLGDFFERFRRFSFLFGGVSAPYFGLEQIFHFYWTILWRFWSCVLKVGAGMVIEVIVTVCVRCR